MDKHAAAAAIIIGELSRTKTAAPAMIPNLTMGTPEKSCADCAMFMVYRVNLPHLHQGIDIIGPCQKWGAYTTSHKLCKAHEQGGPDVR